jgi:glycosyltransferase involved in cell wall biosynthesis
MKVLYLVPSGQWPRQITPFSFLDEEIAALGNAGVEPYVLSTAVEHDQERDAVRIVAVPPGNRLRQRIGTLALLAKHRSRLPGGWRSDARRSLHAVRIELCVAEVVRRFNIDLIHSHFGMPGFAGMLARVETGRPLVASFRGMDLLVDASIDYGLRRDPFYDRTIPALLAQADATTYASEFMRRTALDLGADPTRASTIRKGVDLHHFRLVEDRESLRAQLGVPHPMILTVAGLIPRKGIDTILHALSRLRDTHPFTLVVCGAGTERDNLLRLSESLRLAERVQFRGRVDREEIPRFFAACDVFVLASRLEAAGNVLLEAMASGRPVVTTDSGGPPEYVREGETGFVVPPADADALAGRLRILLDDPALRERMGKAGRALVEREHPYSQLVQGYLEVYRRVLRAPAVAAA